MRRPLYVALVILTVLEVGMLAVLLMNLAVVHDPTTARLIGPVHGVVYLVIAMIALFTPGLRWQLRALGLIPVLGGILAVRAGTTGRPMRNAPHPR